MSACNSVLCVVREREDKKGTIRQQNRKEMMYLSHQKTTHKTVCEGRKNGEKRKKLTNSHCSTIKSSKRITFGIIESILRHVWLDFTNGLHSFSLVAFSIPLNQHDFLTRPNDELIISAIDWNDEWYNRMARNFRIVSLVLLIIVAGNRLFIPINIVVVERLTFNTPVRSFTKNGNWCCVNCFNFVWCHNSLFFVRL